MQQAPLQVRPENTFATKATRGYTKQQEEFYTRTLDLLLVQWQIAILDDMMFTFADITKQKTLTRLPPWTSSWAIPILHLQTPERRKGTANWGRKQELTSSGDVNYPSFTYSKLGGWMWKDMKRAWHVSLWLLVTSSAANCKFAKNLSLWQVCLKLPFRFHETSNKGKAETVYVITLSVSDAKASARQLKVEIKHCQKSTSTAMRNCMKLQIPPPSRITSQHPDCSGFQWQYCSLVSEKCTWTPQEAKILEPQMSLKSPAWPLVEDLKSAIT